MLDIILLLLSVYILYKRHKRNYQNNNGKNITKNGNITNEYYNGFNVADIYKHKSQLELQYIANNMKLNYNILTINLYGGFNIGTMIRTSVIYGCNNFYISGNREFDRRTMVGAQNYVNIERVKDIIKMDRNGDDFNVVCNVKKFINFVKENNYVPIYIEQGGVELSRVNWKSIYKVVNEENKQMLFIFGNESIGIPKELLVPELFEHSMIISIEQYGLLRSLNVATACGIILHNFFINIAL